MKVNEIFLSIQGEGINTGYPTVFVRFTGCNLRCSYCDTKYAYNDGVEMSLDEIISKIQVFPYERVCVTGGEPLLQPDLNDLLERLSDYEVSIETNGSLDISKITVGEKHHFVMDLKCPSSGFSEKMLFSNYDILSQKDEVKIVVGSKEDYIWAKSILQKVYKKGIISFSPVWGKLNPSQLATWIIDDRIDARFQIQLHKVIWGEGKRGV